MGEFHAQFSAIRFQASEAEYVSTLIILCSVIAGCSVGWYGHKVIARVQAWGEKMNEQDLIFQAMSQPEEWPCEVLQAMPIKSEPALPTAVGAFRA